MIFGKLGYKVRRNELLLILARLFALMFSYYLMIMFSDIGNNLFGRYSSILALMTFSAVLFSFGMKTYLFKEAMKNTFRTPYITSNILRVGSVLAVLSYLVLNEYNILEKFNIFSGFEISCMVYLTVTQIWILVLNESNRAAKSFFLYEIFKSTIRPLSVVLCIILWQGPIDIPALFLFVCIANTVSLLLILLFSYKYKYETKKKLPLVIAESKDFWFFENVAIALGALPILMIDFFASEHTLAFTAIFIKVGSIFTILLGFVNTVAGPDIAIEDSVYRARHNEKVNVLFRVCFLIAVGFMLVYLVFANFMIAFFNFSLEGNFWPSFFIILAGSINLATGPSGQILVLQGYQRLVTVLGLSSLFLFVIIMVYGKGTLIAVALALFVQSLILNGSSYFLVMLKSNNEA